MAAVEQGAVAPTVEELAARADEARSRVESLDGPAREAALELLDAVGALDREALVAIVRALRADPRGTELLHALVDEPAVRTVFLARGLIRADPTPAVEQALEGVRPYLRSHGGGVDLVRVEAGVVHVRMTGACNGCSLSALTLREAVEKALVGPIPGIRAVDVVPADPDAPAPEPVLAARVSRWKAGPLADGLGRGLHRVRLGEDDLLVVRLSDDELLAFRNACPHGGSTLERGLLDVEARELVCPGHGYRYDLATGTCLSAPGLALALLPLRVERGRIQVRVA